MSARTRKKKSTFGWREWVCLPELGIECIKAKVDTGARTSALHAFSVRDFEEDGKRRVEFKMHPNQCDTDTVIVCQADIKDERVVRDSGGHEEKRWVIETADQSMIQTQNARRGRCMCWVCPVAEDTGDGPLGGIEQDTGNESRGQKELRRCSACKGAE